MRGRDIMMGMMRVQVVHIERQYTNANKIWQALKSFGFHMIENSVKLTWKNKARHPQRSLLIGHTGKKIRLCELPIDFYNVLL